MKSNKQQVLKIRGVDVIFPIAPYPQQYALIDATLRACLSSSNALLEAPTGTGKSLALLCAALAFQSREKELLQKEAASESESPEPAEQPPAVAVATVVEESSDSDSHSDFKRVLKKGKMARISPVPRPLSPPPNPPKKKAAKVSRIYIASRTHSQISQLVRELKKTAYKPRMVVLGSRDHYCVNPKVENLGSGAKNAACKRLLQETTGCRFNQGKSRVYAHPAAVSSIMDVEDLVALGRQVKGCPYFASRVMATMAELVFCPYNYILEPSIRKNLGIKLENCVIIFDEAHNIESIAADVASFECDLTILAAAVEELSHIVDSSDKAAHLLDSMKRLLQSIEAFAGLKVDDEVVWGGKEILALLDSSRITTETFKELFDTFSDLVSAAEEKNNADEGLVKDHRTADKVLTSVSETTLTNLFVTIQFMLMKEMRYIVDYRAVISKSEERGVQGKSLITRVHFWCCNSAVAFETIKEEARSVILASGTLAPMESFASELGMLFDVRLETGHVVDTNKQLWAGVVPYDLSDKLVFNWSYKNSENVRLQDALGNSLLDIAKIVPFGVLVFFSSYSMMNKVVQRWKATGFWEALTQRKLVLIEPNGPIDDVIASYYASNGMPSSSSSSTTTTTTKKKSSSSRYGNNNRTVNATILPSQTGGMLLAVCRGKVSEGIDFSDQHCRAVVIVGVPFPNTKDLQLRLKKEDHDAKARSNPGFLNGSAWYALQAFRALNQAVGRCIRHQRDFGAIILLDERYLEKRTQENMSRWIRPVIASHLKFGDAMTSLSAFFARNSEQQQQQQQQQVQLQVEPQSHQQQLESPVVSNPSQRWCCAKCARPLALSAAPKLISTSKVRLRRFDASVNQSDVMAESVNVYCFCVDDLNLKVLSRDESGAVYEMQDGVAFLLLSCACSSPVGFFLEAANAQNVSLIGQFWAPQQVFLQN